LVLRKSFTEKASVASLGFIPSLTAGVRREGDDEKNDQEAKSESESFKINIELNVSFTY
jgi:hypothetical protein